MKNRAWSEARNWKNRAISSALAIRPIGCAGFEPGEEPVGVARLLGRLAQAGAYRPSPGRRR